MDRDGDLLLRRVRPGGRRVVLHPAAGTPLVRGRRDPRPAGRGVRRLGRQRPAGAAGGVRVVGPVLGRRRPRRHADRGTGRRRAAGPARRARGRRARGRRGTGWCGEHRRLVRPAQPAAVAAGPGPAVRVHPGVVRGSRTARRGLRVVLRAPRLRGRLPAAAADLRGRGRGPHVPGPAGHRDPHRAAAQDRPAGGGSRGRGHHQRRAAGAGPAGPATGCRSSSCSARTTARGTAASTGRSASYAGCGARMA